MTIPMLTFTKMNGAGNDFVMIDNRAAGLALTRETNRRAVRSPSRHRRRRLDRSRTPRRNGADFRMRYYNADGGEAEMCGNGARCFARFASRLSGRTDHVSFEDHGGGRRRAIARRQCSHRDEQAARSRARREAHRRRTRR